MYMAIPTAIRAIMTIASMIKAAFEQRDVAFFFLLSSWEILGVSTGNLTLTSLISI